MTDGREDGWVEWSGGDCPVPSETMVIFQMRCEERERASNTLAEEAGKLRWKHLEASHDIIAYRVVPTP